MIAMATTRGGVEALCLAPSGPFSQNFTQERTSCASYKSGHHGAIDSPPNYGEEQEALYAAEEPGS